MVRKRTSFGVVWLAMMAALLPILALPSEAIAYSCPGSRCYGTTYWNGLVNGANVRISVASTYYEQRFSFHQ